MSDYRIVRRDTRVKYHIHELINTMYFVYKQNFMRCTLYEKFLQHELYQDLENEVMK